MKKIILFLLISFLLFQNSYAAQSSVNEKLLNKIQNNVWTDINRLGFIFNKLYDIENNNLYKEKIISIINSLLTDLSIKYNTTFLYNFKIDLPKNFTWTILLQNNNILNYNNWFYPTPSFINSTNSRWLWVYSTDWNTILNTYVYSTDKLLLNDKDFQNYKNIFTDSVLSKNEINDYISNDNNKILSYIKLYNDYISWKKDLNEITKSTGSLFSSSWSTLKFENGFNIVYDSSERSLSSPEFIKDKNWNIKWLWYYTNIWNAEYNYIGVQYKIITISKDETKLFDFTYQTWIQKYEENAKTDKDVQKAFDDLVSKVKVDKDLQSNIDYYKNMVSSF
jgi:hypothetical protein